MFHMPITIVWLATHVISPSGLQISQIHMQFDEKAQYALSWIHLSVLPFIHGSYNNKNWILSIFWWTMASTSWKFITLFSHLLLHKVSVKRQLQVPWTTINVNPWRLAYKYKEEFYFLWSWPSGRMKYRFLKNIFNDKEICL